MRSHYCGQLRDTHIGEEVSLNGWVHRRRDHGGVIFLDLRDREGIVQVVFDPDAAEAFELADQVRSEYVLAIRGRVRAREGGAVNPRMATGTVEVLGSELTILNTFACGIATSICEDRRCNSACGFVPTSRTLSATTWMSVVMSTSRPRF